MVIWLTGLSGAGKTTLALALRDLLKPSLPQVVLVDGDVVREAFGATMGYTEPERVVQIQRIQRLAKILSDQDQIVLVAALYAHPDLLDWNRENLREYVEVYIEASMELLRKRDQKSLYSMAESGETRHVVGVDIPWHAPGTADLTLDADSQTSPVEMARLLLEKVPVLKTAFTDAAKVTV